jgi:putative acetyltransferase
MDDSLLRMEAADPRSAEAATLIAALSAELARLYDYTEDGSGNFVPEDVLVPRSEFLIGRVGEIAVACGAFRPLDDETAEIKRMYVQPEYRGRGYSKLLLAELERRAREAGYKRLRLETADRQPEAIGLYERSGYVRVPSYKRDAEAAWSVYFEKQL